MYVCVYAYLKAVALKASLLTTRISPITPDHLKHKEVNTVATINGNTNSKHLNI